MQYFVMGTDGKEYGPVGLDQLKAWVGEKRVHRDTALRDFHTGQSILAGNVQGLFEPEAPVYAAPTNSSSTIPGASSSPMSGSIPGTNYGPSVGGQQYSYPVQESVWPFMWVIGEALLGIIFFFVLGRLGIIFAGFSFYNAIKLKMQDSKYAIPGLIFSGLCLAAVVVGWVMRLSGTNV